MLRSERRPFRGSGPAVRGLAIVVTSTAVLALSGVSGASATSSAATASPGELSATAAAQIAALQQIKASLSPAEQKLDSRLAVAERQRRDKAATAALPKVSTGVRLTATGRTTVDIAAAAVTADLLGRLRGLGATVLSSSKRLATVRVEAPLTAMTTIASWTDVRRVSIAAGAMTEGTTTVPAATVNQGSVVSEGDKTEAADKARALFKVTGVGVKVCVLSDGVDSLAAAQATGDLPAVDVRPGQEGDGDEGTAMLEIVHDLAPSAALGFATAFTSDSSFADNIRDLRFGAHCDVIVDDVLYFNEDPFQDGPIAQSVNAVTADGAVYFSSAGNEGNTLNGTSGNYEGTFVDSGQQVGKFAGTAHDFNPGAGVQVFEPLSDASSLVPVTLWWADALHAASDDYDLYLFDASGNILNFSQDVQNGSQDPFEILQSDSGAGQRLAVVKYAGSARYFQLSALRGRFRSSSDGLVARVSPGVTRGHSATVDAFSVGAAPAHEPLPFDLEEGDPANPSGPYPDPFTRAQKPERFTSDGPRRVFFDADGTPITPGNFTSTGGAVRQKPDVTAADGVSTTLDPSSGLNPFFGTSAAAPHAAAIAALVLSGNPGASTAFIRAAFDATALDLAPAGVDGRTGHGIVRADRMLANTGATPQALVVTGQPMVTVTAGDADAFLEPGETASLGVPANSIGDGRATGVSVQVVSSDPLATITPASKSYGNIAAGATRTMPFTLKLASTYPRGKRVSLAITVSFGGGSVPSTSTTVTLPTGQPATTATTYAYGGPPVAIPDDDPTGASVPIAVSGVGYASGLTFSIDGSTCTAAEGATTVGLDHTFVSDLTGTLTSPSGATATLFSGSGLGGNNLCKVVFDDTAAAPFSSVTEDLAPFTGRWQPADPLAGLLGAPVDGTWTFSVVDDAAVDTGPIRAVALHIKGFQP
jgi:subtilisin-like proprotein convertase family protein